jgi:hypothetical protein
LISNRDFNPLNPLNPLLTAQYPLLSRSVDQILDLIPKGRGPDFDLFVQSEHLVARDPVLAPAASSRFVIVQTGDKSVDRIREFASTVERASNSSQSSWKSLP